MTKKLVSAQNELDDRREKMSDMIKEIEARRAENSKLRKEIDDRGRDVAHIDALKEIISDKDAKIEELHRAMAMLEMDVNEFKAQKEAAKAEAEEQLAELEGKLSQVELLLLKKKARLQKTKSGKVELRCFILWKRLIGALFE